MTAAASGKAPRWRPWATLGVTVLLGPQLGMVAFLIPLAVTTGLKDGLEDGLWMLAAVLNPVVWLFPYLIGGIPAAIGGAAFVLLDWYVPPRFPRVAMAIAIGGVATTLFWLAVRTSGGAMSDLLGLGAAGAFAAGVTAHLTRRWRYTA